MNGLETFYSYVKTIDLVEKQRLCFKESSKIRRFQGK